MLVSSYRHRITDEVVEKYLQCGDPHFGFARIRCKECGAEYLRAFSCKCRGFCWVMECSEDAQTAFPASQGASTKALQMRLPGSH